MPQQHTCRPVEVLHITSFLTAAAVTSCKDRLTIVCIHSALTNFRRTPPHRWEGVTVFLAKVFYLLLSLLRKEINNLMNKK